MKFAMSYSCGKDSTLALRKMMEQGHEPVCLVVMVNEDVSRSYFHGADEAMLAQYSESLNLPLITCPANGETYQRKFEAGLEKAKQLGAEAVCFGDIDLEQNKQWEVDRCGAIGLVPFFPLWQEDRKDIVQEIIDLGYKCLIKSINNTQLPDTLLGQLIDNDSVAVMREYGIDECGENGEYHTLAIDGPVFQKSIPYELGQIVSDDDYSYIEIEAA